MNYLTISPFNWKKEKCYKQKYSISGLTLMFDFCSSCIWEKTDKIRSGCEGCMLEWECLRISPRTQILLNRFCEELDRCLNFYCNLDSTELDAKIFYRSNKYKQLLKLQYKIAQNLKKEFPRLNIYVWKEHLQKSIKV